MEAAIVEAPQVLGEPRQLLTAEEFYATCELDRAELVRGRVVELKPRIFVHGLVVGNIILPLHDHIRSHSLGDASLGAGFRVSRSPDTVRCPNVSFVCAKRLLGADLSTFIEGAPNLAVEVVPRDAERADVEHKAEEYLDAGAEAVWLIDIPLQIVTVRTPDETRVYRHDQMLSGEPVLPGFQVALSEIFE